MLTYLHIVHGCFYAAEAKFSRYRRDHMTNKPQNTIWPFIEKVCLGSFPPPPTTPSGFSLSPLSGPSVEAACFYQGFVLWGCTVRASEGTAGIALDSCFMIRHLDRWETGGAESHEFLDR